MRPCVICNEPLPLTFLSHRKTCSSQCAREHMRRKWRHKRARRRARLLASRHKKFCQTCNADISWRRLSALYCSRKCVISAQHAQEREIARTRIWLCRKCGQPVLPRRFVCDECLSPRKKGGHRKGYSYINEAKTFEERIARIERRKQSTKEHNKLVRAANQVYRELQGKTKNPSLPPLPPPTCVVCGIALIGFRKRILCGSRLCQEDRERERWICRYWGMPVRMTPRMIAAAEITNGKFRDRKPDRRRRKRIERIGRTRERSQHEYTVYLAMRELNLLPTKENTP